MCLCVCVCGGGLVGSPIYMVLSGFVMQTLCFHICNGHNNCVFE